MASYIPSGFNPTGTIPGQSPASTGLASFLPGGALPKALMGLAGAAALYFVGKNVFASPGADTYENSGITPGDTPINTNSDTEESETANSDSNPAETEQPQTGWGRVAAIGSSLVTTLGGGFYFRKNLAAMAPKVFSSAAAVAAKQPTKSIQQKVGAAALGVAGSAAKHAGSFGLHCGRVGIFAALLTGLGTAYNKFFPSVGSKSNSDGKIPEGQKPKLEDRIKIVKIYNERLAPQKKTLEDFLKTSDASQEDKAKGRNYLKCLHELNSLIENKFQSQFVPVGEPDEEGSQELIYEISNEPTEGTTETTDLLNILRDAKALEEAKKQLPQSVQGVLNQPNPTD
ncbi:MAG: hypothetical protein AAGI66_07710 [Cyanobacteria bacterium P01_H01_bin.74]